MTDGSHRSWSRFYVPEIHDVHPGMETGLDALLAAFPSEARDKTALLVVPDWQGHEPLKRNEPFCRRLSEHKGEIVLHGLNHSLGPSWWNWLMFGHDNRSEFARLSESDARRRRLKLGREMLEDIVGFMPRWFCAPRWQQSKATTAAVCAMGFFGFQLQKRLAVCSGETIPLNALCFDEGERALKIAAGRHLRNAKIERLLASGQPFRLTLHPSDPLHAKTWQQAKTLIARLEAEGWAALSLDEAAGLWRSLARTAA